MCPTCSKFPTPTSRFREVAENMERHAALHVCVDCGQYIELIAEERSPRYISEEQRLLDYPKSLDLARRYLGGVAYGLCEEIHNGVWDDSSDIRDKPGPECNRIIKELKRRCPGFTTYEYKRAISSGLMESR